MNDASQPELASRGAEGEPPLTVIAICTMDRPEQLRLTLESFAAQPAAARMDVLVADNSVSGSAHGVWEEFAGEFAGRADYISVTRPGLSVCRNAALARAESTFVTYVDDDVTLSPDWFEALSAGLRQPGTVAAGGRIVLQWEGGRAPRWLRPEYEAFFSGLDLGDAERDFRLPHEMPVGANFTIHREQALHNGGFDTNLGRTGTNLIGGEEIDMVLRLAPFGAIRYLPDAWLYHRVSAERASRRWLLKRCFAQGKTAELMTIETALEEEPHMVNSEEDEGKTGVSMRQVPMFVAWRLGARLGQAQNLLSRTG